MFNAITASESIKNAYIDYLATTFRFADRDYDRLFRNELKKPGVLAKGAYLDVNGSYETGASLRELMTAGTISPLFNELEKGKSRKELPLDRPLYLHQQKAIERAANDENLVVTTGTGSGKTECFLIPAINELLREKESGTLSQPGVRTLIIYPMNALANDQLKRLRDILGSFEDITFGVYNGNTPDKLSTARSAYLSTYNEEPLPNEIISRDKMRSTPPHILITNYSMLEHTLLRPKDDYIFSGAKLRFLILDEAHIYKGATGIETALLIRRLCSRLGNADKVRYILTSATLGGKDSDNDIIGFMKNLCGADMNANDIIRSTEKCPSLKAELEFPSEMFQKLIEDDDTAAVLAEYNADFAPNGDNSEKLFELCLHSRLFGQFRKMTENPITFDELYNAVSTIRSITQEQLSAFIEVCARAIKNNTALVKPRYHYFLRALDGAYVTINEPKQLFIEQKEKDETTGQCVFEAGVCDTCGRLSILGLEQGGCLKQTRRTYHAYTPRRADELFDSGEPDEETGCGENDYVICPKCGAIGSEADAKFGNMPCHCNYEHEYINVTEAFITEGGKMKCPACEFGTITPIINGANAATSVLATELFEQLPDSKITTEKAPAINDDLFSVVDTSPITHKERLTRQFLCFSDSRRDAAFFAPYLESSYAEMLRRRGVWKIAEELKNDGIDTITVPEFAQRLRKRFAQEVSFSAAETESNAWVALLNEMVRTNSSTGLVSFGKIAFTYKTNDALAEKMAQMSNGQLTVDEAHAFLDLLVMDLVQNGSIDCGDSYKLTDEERQYLFYTAFSKWAIKQGEKGNSKFSWIPKSSKLPNNRMIRVMNTMSDDEKYNTSEKALKFLGDYWDAVFGRKLVKGELLLDACDFRINLNAHFYKCNKCGKVTPYNVHGHCPDLRCSGSLIDFDYSEVENNHYVRLYRSVHMQPLRIKEHTAQLDRETASRYQEMFKNKELNALSCSTTFEMGVDLGSLETVFMRDVPPSPANYVQRAGRAGRSLESSAFVLTFAKRSSHDFTFYADPKKMISGKIDVPKFEVINEKIAARHIYAVAFSCFFKIEPDVYGAGLDEFLDSGYQKFCDYLAIKPDELKTMIKSFLPATLIRRLKIDDWKWTEKLVGDEGLLTIAVNDLKADIKEIEKITKAAAKEKDFAAAGNYQNFTKNLLKGSGSYSNMLTDFLVRHNILPKYGFPVDVVQLNTNTLSCAQGRRLDLNRDLQLAIADYAPGSEVIADGNTYVSRFIRKMPDSKGGSGWELGNTAKCDHCGEVSFTKMPIIKGGKNCVHCGSPIPKNNWHPTLEPRLGFAAEFRKGVNLTPPSHGVKSEDHYIGDGHGRLIGKTAFDINGQTVVMESTANDSLVVLSMGDYFVCPTCGRADKKPMNQNKEKKHRNMYGVECSNKTPGKQYYLSHDFKTDVVKLIFDDAMAEDIDTMQSVLYALLEGISKELGIERNDIKGCCFRMPFKGREVVSLIIYDAAAGGAGHVRRLITDDGDVLRCVIRASLERVENCTCDSSCYFCLRNYYNQHIHDRLDRKIAADFLRKWVGTPKPIELEEEPILETPDSVSEPDATSNPTQEEAAPETHKLSLAWQGIIDILTPAAAEFVSGLTDADSLFPGEDNIGIDIPDENGQVICNAELYWNDGDKKVILLDPEYSDKKHTCEKLGYDVYVAGVDDKEAFENTIRKDKVTL